MAKWETRPGGYTVPVGTPSSWQPGQSFSNPSGAIDAAGFNNNQNITSVVGSGYTNNGNGSYSSNHDSGLQAAYDAAYGSYSAGLGAGQPNLQPIDNAAALAERLRLAREQQAIGSLQNAYQNQLGVIDQTKKDIDPRYRTAGIQASTSSELAKKRLQEQMAMQGLARSGASATAQIEQNSALQGVLGNLEAQKQSEFDTLDMRKQQLGTALEGDIVTTKAGLEAESLRNAIEQSRIDDLAMERERQQAFENALAREGMDFKYEGFEEDKRRYGLDYALKLQDLAQKGTRTASGGGSSTQTVTVGKAESKANYYDVMDELTYGITVGLSKEKLRAYLASVRTALTESDYLKLVDQMEQGVRSDDYVAAPEFEVRDQYRGN